VRAGTTGAGGAGECIPGETAAVLQRPVYTAFGELVYDLAPQDTFIRYRYAGDWGYEGRLGSETNGGSDSALGLPYTHVGHRWYDPSTGRFLQRDPVGIRGGLNTYGYVSSNPPMFVDPWGLSGPFDDVDAAIETARRSAACASHHIIPRPQVHIPADFSKPPGTDWIWRGKGAPGSAQGQWVNPRTGEHLRKHIHFSCHGPHYDYVDPKKIEWRIYPDGRTEIKNTKQNRKRLRWMATEF